MIEIVWEIVVKEEGQGHFELAFGPGGAWSKLFARRPGYRGTTLLRDVDNPQRYLAIDLWDTVDQRQQALAEGQAEVAELETAFARWIVSRTEVGVFRIRAEATVRPHLGARRGRAKGAQRKRGRSTG